MLKEEYADELPRQGYPVPAMWWDYVSHEDTIDRDELLLVLSEVNNCSPDDILLHVPAMGERR